ncbi:MAG: HD domain-containing protein [Anaerolineae bacterium]
MSTGEEVLRRHAGAGGGLRRAWHRVQQFWHAVWAPLDPDLPHEALEWLAPGELALFRTMSPAGKRHGAAVARTLLAWGYRERPLLAAALLHDVGKEVEGHLRLWHRVAIVLLSAFWPQALPWLARRSWGRAFRAHLTHAEVGAQRAREAGAAPLTVDLIRRHHEPPEGPASDLYVALWQADEWN